MYKTEQMCLKKITIFRALEIDQRQTFNWEAFFPEKPLEFQ